MISSESKEKILRNLSSSITRKDKERVMEETSFSSKISYDRRKLQEDFTENFKIVSGEVYALEKKENLGEKITELLSKLKTQSVSFWNTELFRALGLPGDTDIKTADVGITEADFAIADTGTLVLLSSPQKMRTVSLLPPVHIAVLKKENIVADIHALFVELEKLYNGNYDELCSCISFITGPSRTADIELNLTVGVHGPGRAIAVIV